LAQILNCSQPTEEGPCQECYACHKIITGNHPDVLWLKPLKTTIGIEQVLAWQQKVYLKHYEGNYKISVIEQADSVTLPAANALLKFIEEPPERTVIILCAQNAEGILPTIQSRAQLVYFHDLSEGTWLTGLGEVDQQEAAWAFLLSGKNQNLATTILEHGVTILQEWIEKFRTAIEERDFLKLSSLFPIDKSKPVFIYKSSRYRRKKGFKKVLFGRLNFWRLEERLMYYDNK